MNPEYAARTLKNVTSVTNLFDVAVTLHLNGPNSPYWTLSDRELSIFLHPTVTKLHVSCMNILDHLSESISGNLKGRTPLKNLILEECNISCDGLEALLSLPTALESLYLGENCHNFRHFREPRPVRSNYLFLSQSKGTLRALEQQKHSLKALTYLTPAYYPTTTSGGFPVSIHDKGYNVDGGFADFLSLQESTLVGY